MIDTCEYPRCPDRQSMHSKCSAPNNLTFWKWKKCHSMIGATLFLCGVCRGCFRYYKVLQPTTLPRAHGKTPLCCTSCHLQWFSLKSKNTPQCPLEPRRSYWLGTVLENGIGDTDRTRKDLTPLLLLLLQHHLLPPPTLYDHPRSSQLLQLNSPETPDLCGLISNFIKPPGSTWPTFRLK